MTINVTGIVSKNSLEYVHHAFTVLRDGRAFVNIPGHQNTSVREGLNISELLEPSASFGWFSGTAYVPRTENSIAQISYTSGTEGKPKGVLISHAALANTTQRLTQIMEIDNEIREYIGIPVNYSFGFGRCRVVSAAGGQFYLPEHGFNPLEIVQMLEADEINAISAVPSLWRLVLEVPEIFAAVAMKVRWIEIGSQYMSADEKERLRNIFNNAKIVQHYGLTEASRSTFLDIQNADPNQLESVGRGYFGVETSINSEGHIQIRGPHLASSLLVDGELRSVADEDGWLTTNDGGYLDESDGFLYFEGRLDDIINLGGTKLSPESLELALSKQLNIEKGNIAVFKTEDATLGEQLNLAAIAELKIEDSLLRSTVQKCLDGFGIKIGNHFPLHRLDKFPFTDTGKLKRKELTARFSTKPDQLPAAEPQVSASPSVNAEDLVHLWQEVLNISPISPQDNFFDIGGDSISAIRVTLRMEKAGVPKEICRKIFEGYSIENLVASIETENKGNEEDQNTEQALLDENNTDEAANLNLYDSSSPQKRTAISSANLSLNVIRGLLVVMNIAAHWIPAVISRLPVFAAEINKYFAPLYSSGTPGFALVFGAGLSFFIFPRFSKNKASVLKLCKRNALILGVGILCLAGLKTAVRYFNGLIVVPTDVSNTLYSVLFYYFFAVISIPVWLRMLTWKGSFRVSCLLLASLFYSCHLFIDALNIPPSENPLIQTGILILTPKYNYLEMSAAVMLGAAAGNWIKESIDARKSIFPLLSSGALLVFLSVIISFEAGEYGLWFVWPKGLYLWTWFFYLGCILIGFYGLFGYIEKHDVNSHPRTGFVLRVLSVVGVMAFPLFIGHELVKPLAELLSTFSVPGGLAISLLIFFSYSFYLLKKLYSLYYKVGE